MKPIPDFPAITAEHWRIAFNRKENNDIKDKLRNIMRIEKPEDLRIGQWATLCCHLDMYEIESAEDIEEIKEHWDKGLRVSVWSDKLSALKDISSHWPEGGDEHKECVEMQNIMSEKNELPETLAGYQCVESGPIKEGDVWVHRGEVSEFALHYEIGDSVHIHSSSDFNLYRKMPVATNLENEESIPRKQRPVASGVLDYFPDALMEVAYCSYMGNEQHNKGKPLHWDRSKSGDEADALIRHFLERGKVDSDGVRHSAKLAWRSLSLLQKEIENAQNPTP